jgi:transcriptional regulator with XRE-family HTH domain
MKDRRSNVVGSSLREIRLAKGLSQEDLALRSGVSATLISRYENARRNISLQNQQKLTDALEVDREQLLSGIIQPSTKRMPLRRNPKPIRLNDVVLDSIFLMLGNHSEPMEISLHYKPHPLQIPQKIRPVYESLAVKSKETALAKGFPYFNGPNTRLLRANEVHNRQAKQERKFVESCSNWARFRGNNSAS